MAPTSATRSRVIGLVLVLAAIVLPGLVLTIAGRSDAAGASALAASTGLMAMLATGPRIAVPLAVLLGPASALAVLTAELPVAAAVLMGAVAAAAGLGARLHASAYLVMAPIGLAFLLAEPPRDPAGDPLPALAVILVTAGSALWAAGIAWLLVRGRHRDHAEPMAWSRVGAFAAVLGVAVGGASAAVTALDLGHGGAWFVMTLLVVIQPYVRDAWSKTVQRAVGTVVGFALALVAGMVVGHAVVVYLVAAAFLAVALLAWQAWHRPYWQYVAMLTPAIVLFEGASTSIVDTALARLGFTLLGVAVAIALEAVAIPFERRAHRAAPVRGPG